MENMTFKEKIDKFLFYLEGCTKGSPKEIYKICKYSVSKIVDTLHEPFDKEGVARKTFAKYFNDENSKYYHMSVEDILSNWEEKAKIGRNNGQALDNYIGMILEKKESEEILNKFKESSSEIVKKKCKLFDKFYKDNIENKLEFITREQILHDPIYTEVVGRFDAIFTKGENLLLIDWKNTEKIETENRWAKLRGPLYKYDDCELNRYTIQLYIYTYLLRTMYELKDIKIIPLLVQIGSESYMIYSPQIPYSDKLVEDIIEYAKAEINKK